MMEEEIAEIVEEEYIPTPVPFEPMVKLDKYDRDISKVLNLLSAGSLIPTEVGGVRIDYFIKDDVNRLMLEGFAIKLLKKKLKLA